MPHACGPYGPVAYTTHGADIVNQQLSAQNATIALAAALRQAERKAARAARERRDTQIIERSGCQCPQRGCDCTARTHAPNALCWTCMYNGHANASMGERPYHGPAYTGPRF